MTAATAEKTTTPEREAPVVRVECVKRQAAGSVFTQWYVTFPEHGIPDDLKQPHIWKRIQTDARTTFRPKDELRVDAFDGSWTVRCIVSHASLTGVVLAVGPVMPMPERVEHLYSDDLYAVKFTGAGYAVVRKRDNQQMGADAWPNPAIAEKALMNLYPKVVG